jgi:hypothetical protein
VLILNKELLGHKKGPQIEDLIGDRKYINGNLE